MQRAADLEAGDVDGEPGRDVVRLGGDEQRGHRLVDDAVLAGDQLGLALEGDGHLDVDGLVQVDPEEVHVEDVAPHRVPLHVLEEGRHRAATLDVEVDHGVEALVGDQRGAQLPPVHGEVHRVATEAVDDAGDLAGATEAPDGPGALGDADGGVQLDLGHRKAPTSEIAPERYQCGRETLPARSPAATEPT